jgi:hypothetical protein
VGIGDGILLTMKGMSKIKYMKTLIKILILLTLVSCVTKKKIEKYATHDTVIREVVKEKIISKDSLVEVQIPFDDTFLKAYYECDSLGQLHFTYIEELEGKLDKAHATVVVRDNYVEVECKCDSGIIYSIWKSRFESNTSSANTTINTSESSTTVKTKLPWWMIPGGILVLVIGAIIGYLIKMFGK